MLAQIILLALNFLVTLSGLYLVWVNFKVIPDKREKGESIEENLDTAQSAATVLGVFILLNLLVWLWNTYKLIIN